MRLNCRWNSWWRRSYRAGVCRNHLLHNGEVAISWMDAMRLKEQSMHLLQTNPGIRIDHRRHIYPIGPGLRHESVRLELVEKILTLLDESLHLIRRDGGGKRLVSGIELLM